MTDCRSISRRTMIAATLAGLPLAGGLTLGGPARGALAVDRGKLDAIVDKFMTSFDIPGVAVAIIAPGMAPFTQGYGVRTLGKPAKIDAHTRFGIASNSKAFTAAALALLVDDGKIGWDEPVTRYLPEFRMYDPAVTQMMTVRDLLVHRSGLPLGAGDLMYFPASSHTAADVLTALRSLKPARGFRAGYDYDNILYIVAGLLIERVSGQEWRQVIAARLLAPIGMVDAVPSRFLLTTDNVAGRHARLGPPARGMGEVAVIAPDEPAMVDACGGINASVTDIAKWLQLQLDHGVLPSGKRLWSEQQAAEMWKPQTIIAASDGPTADLPARAVSTTYALGWFVQDYRGERLISHSGGLSGQITQTAMLPARGIGVVVFTNIEDRTSAWLRNAILDLMIGAPTFDWVESCRTARDKRQAEALAGVGDALTQRPAGEPSLPLDRYAGRYRDPWYGDILVETRGPALHISFLPTPLFSSDLEPWGADSFRTHFAKDAGEDALISFKIQDGHVSGVTMKALSPLADFSYDFQHLSFVPVG